MKNQELITKTAEFIRQKFEDESSGHDWWHLYRVWQLSRHIAAKEKGADMLVVELAALLHDIEDHKLHGGDSEVGALAARNWLQKIKADKSTIAQVEDIVRNISFKGANHKINLQTLEGWIVHDADKLDAMGAIGISRVFAFGGSRGRLIHNPDSPLTQKKIAQSSFTSDGHSSGIDHFYEKLLLLKDRMFTETGRQMALRRHKFMEEYLKEFYAEWEGEH